MEVEHHPINAMGKYLPSAFQFSKKHMQKEMERKQV
jgi:hypothetical protein